MQLQKRFVIEEAAKYLQETGFPLVPNDIKELELIFEDIPYRGSLSDMAERLSEEFINRKFDRSRPCDGKCIRNKLRFGGMDATVAVNGIRIPEVQSIVWKKKLAALGDSGENDDGKIITGKLGCMVLYDVCAGELRTTMEMALARPGGQSLVVAYEDERGNQAIEIFIEPVFEEVNGEITPESAVPVDTYTFRAKSIWRGRVPDWMSIWDTDNRSVLNPKVFDLPLYHLDMEEHCQN